LRIVTQQQHLHGTLLGGKKGDELLLAWLLAVFSSGNPSSRKTEITS
jgi:hypothetical protein